MSKKTNRFLLLGLLFSAIVICVIILRDRVWPGKPTCASGQGCIYQNAYQGVSGASEWMKARDPGLKITQTKNPNKEPGGTLRSGNMVCNLGETPPRYRAQLVTVAGSILLGEKDDRHTLNRSMSLVTESQGQLSINGTITAIYPRKALSRYGFVFKRAENPVETVGVIVPHLPLKKNRNPNDYLVTVRYPGGFREFSDKDAKTLSVTNANDDVVLVLGDGPTLEFPVNVLWFRISKEGFVILRDDKSE